MPLHHMFNGLERPFCPQLMFTHAVRTAHNVHLFLSMWPDHPCCHLAPFHTPFPQVPGGVIRSVPVMQDDVTWTWYSTLANSEHFGQLGVYVLDEQPSVVRIGHGDGAVEPSHVEQRLEVVDVCGIDACHHEQVSMTTVASAVLPAAHVAHTSDRKIRDDVCPLRFIPNPVNIGEREVSDQRWHAPHTPQILPEGGVFLERFPLYTLQRSAR